MHCVSMVVAVMVFAAIDDHSGGRGYDCACGGESGSGG